MRFFHEGDGGQVQKAGGVRAHVRHYTHVQADVSNGHVCIYRFVDMCAVGNGSEFLTLKVFRPTDVMKYSDELLNT